MSYSDSPTKIEDDRVALIFGTSNKLQYVDPFLFLAYQLRRWTIEAARLVVTIGYGFMDDHINEILGQALRQDRKEAVTGGRWIASPGKAAGENQIDCEPAPCAT